MKNDIDYVAASFIRKADDVLQIKKFIAEHIDKYQPSGHPHPVVISKIESTEGLLNFDEILAVSDGIMVICLKIDYL